jgi:hypothetical protein
MAFVPDATRTKRSKPRGVTLPKADGGSLIWTWRSSSAVTRMTVRHESAKEDSCKQENFFRLCCTRDERRPLELALQDVGSNHRKLLRHNGRGGERFGKRQDLILSGKGRGDERKRTADDLSKA